MRYLIYMYQFDIKLKSKRYKYDINMIIVISGIKGGSSGTTVATNLAVMRSSYGKDVLLVDADDQETSTDFTILRNEIF